MTRPVMMVTCASVPGRDQPRVTRQPRKSPIMRPLSALLSLLSAQKDDTSAADAVDPAINRAQVPPTIVAKSPKLRAVNGDPVRAPALGGNRNVRQPKSLAPTAQAHGVNYFFAYSMRDDQIGDYLDGLAELCADPKMRRKIFIAVGTENFKNRDAITAHVERCLSRLGTTYIDAFFLEYVARGDEAEAVEAIRWMRNEGGLVVGEGGRAGVDGVVRFVGCSTHDRCAGIRLLRSQRDGRGFIGEGAEEGADIDDEDELPDFAECELDALMARYNMAHTKAERTLFPLARARNVPVVAFTTTRWNSLQKGHEELGGRGPADGIGVHAMGARGGRGGGGCAELAARFESIEGAVRGVGGWGGFADGRGGGGQVEAVRGAGVRGGRAVRDVHVRCGT